MVQDIIDCIERVQDNYLINPFFRNQSESSVWLTAYVVRVFQEASFYEWENFIYIDPVVISKSVNWILQHQNSDGAFWEPNWLPDRKYNSSLNYDNDHIRYRNITLTAHVLITLEHVKDLTSKFSDYQRLQLHVYAWYYNLSILHTQFSLL